MITLSADIRSKIDRELAKYPPDQKQSAVMHALAAVQDEHGWLSTDLMDAVAHYLGMQPGAGFGETTKDGKFTLKEGECLGACGDAPVLIVNDRRMCSFMSNERLDELVDELSEAADRGEGRPGWPKE